MQGWARKEHNNASSEGRYVGIDVSKGQLDVAVEPGEEHWSVGNEEEGIGTPVGRLDELPHVLCLHLSGSRR